MKRDYPLFIHKDADGYSACVPSLGILVAAETVDECYVKVEETKKALLESIVDRGFGDSMLSVAGLAISPRPWVRMAFAVAILSLLLLTVLIPANYLLSELNRRVPAYVESAMDVVQRRVQQMSDDDKRKLSGLTTGMCPVIDEMVAARCRSLPAQGAPSSAGKPR
jgi:predicted RNase H-like HicB family nuclease